MMETETVVILSSDDEMEIQPKMNKRKEDEEKSPGENERNYPPKKKFKVEEVDTNKNKVNDVANQDTVEESDIFKEFLDTCIKLDSSSAMQKIIDRKLRRYYQELKPNFRNSEILAVLLERKLTELKRSPCHIFMHIKDVVDELQAHRVDKKTAEPRTSDRMVRKLCRAVELLQRKIKKLEEKEVDWDEDEDSSYIQLQRYRERLVKVYRKLQELEGEDTNLSRKRIIFSGTQFPTVNRAIEKYVNTKGQFPDFHDILDLLKTSYAAENISVTPDQLHVQAKHAFQNIGEQLQKQRQYECWDAHRVFLQEDDDPADEDTDLRSALDENKQNYKLRIDEVINSFAEKATKSVGSGEESNASEGADSVKNEKSGDDEEEDENEEEDGEEVENETADDILEIIEKETPTDELDNTSEPLVQYCGPVSPPNINNGVGEEEEEEEAQKEEDKECDEDKAELEKAERDENGKVEDKRDSEHEDKRDSEHEEDRDSVHEDKRDSEREEDRDSVHEEDTKNSEGEDKRDSEHEDTKNSEGEEDKKDSEGEDKDSECEEDKKDSKCAEDKRDSEREEDKGDSEHEEDKGDAELAGDEKDAKHSQVERDVSEVGDEHSKTGDCDKDMTISTKVKMEVESTENSAITNKQTETKTFLKVKPLSCLQNKPSTIVDDDIVLLD